MVDNRTCLYQSTAHIVFTNVCTHDKSHLQSLTTILLIFVIQIINYTGFAFRGYYEKLP